MPTLFTRIINGELPGHFVWRDPLAVAFMTIRPVSSGHTLVVPRQEVDHWLDADEALRHHLFNVSHAVGEAVQAAFSPARVGLLIAGLEVPHLHIHVMPVNSPLDVELSQAHEASPEQLKESAEKIRSALRQKGRAEVSD